MVTGSEDEQAPNTKRADPARSDLPARLESSLGRYALTDEEMADMIATGPRSVRAWITRSAPIGPPVLRIIELLDILDRAERLFGAEGVRGWLYTEDPAFEGHFPAELIQRGDGRTVAGRVTRLENEDLAG